MATQTDTSFALEDQALPAVDLTDEQEFLRKLLGTMQLLNQFQSSFDDERAVCQAQVKALIDECEMSLDDRYPLQSFTQAPSPQNLSIVTEGIFRRSATVVVNLIKKVVEMIKKMFSWIIAAIKNIFSRQKAVHQRVVMVKVLATANAEVKPVTDPLPAASPAVQQAQAALDTAVGRFGDFYSELAHTLLTQSPYLGAIKGISLFMPKIAELLGMKLGLAETFLKDTNQDRGIFAMNLTKLAVPLPIMRLEQVAERYSPLKNKNTLLEFFDALKAHTTALHSARPKGVMDWQVATAMVIDPRSGFDEPLVTIPDDIQRAFQVLITRIDALAHPDILGHIDPAMMGHYDAAMMSMLADAHALALYAEAINVVLDTQAGLAVSLFQCHKALFDLHRAKAQDSQDPTAINAINAIQHRLRETITNR